MGWIVRVLVADQVEADVLGLGSNGGRDNVVDVTVKGRSRVSNPHGLGTTAALLMFMVFVKYKSRPAVQAWTRLMVQVECSSRRV